MLFRVSRRYAFAALTLAIIALGFLSGPASAESVDLGHHSEAEIKAACLANGGQYASTYNGNYWCIGKGNQGTVACGPDGTCRGYCSNCKGVTAKHLPTLLNGTGIVNAKARAATPGTPPTVGQDKSAAIGVKPVVEMHHAPVKKSAGAGASAMTDIHHAR
jgi:hypothetical protein